MNGFSLSYYLEDLRRVDALSLEQLNTLVAKYPYCQLLQGLLTRKSNESALSSSFKQAQVSKLGLFNGRVGKFFDLVYKNFPKLVQKSAPSLSEKLDAPIIKMESAEPQKEEAKEITGEKTDEVAPPKVAVIQLKVQKEATDMHIESPIAVGKRMRKMLSKFNRKATNVSDNELIDEEFLEEALANNAAEPHSDLEPNMPYTASNFVQWLKSFRKPTIKALELPVIERSQQNRILVQEAPAKDDLEVKKERKKKKKSKKKQKKKKSSGLIIKEEIYSETLADLLAEQGHNSKAIKMYERLSLIFPEKSALFAVKIEKIKRRSE